MQITKLNYINKKYILCIKRNIKYAKNKINKMHYICFKNNSVGNKKLECIMSIVLQRQALNK